MKKSNTKNRNNRLTTATFAVCALNESANIGPHLESVLTQIEEGFKLEKILIVSDGSTDNTVKIAKSFKSKKIEIWDFKQRKGKSSRLNEIYADLKSDILILVDADVILGTPYVFRDLVKPMARDLRVGMTGAHPLPLPAENFLEKAINCTLAAYIPLRKVLKGGNNILSATGRGLAMRKELVKKITVPVDTIANDGFSYFCCITNGFEYRYAPKAVVWFRSPQSLKDHISQNTRFLATVEWMSQYFPRELVVSEYHIPANLLNANMLKEFIKNPIHTAFIFALNKYCALRAAILKKKINAIWDIVYSTKTLKN